MKFIIFILVFSWLNSSAQICQSYKQFDSLYSNSKYVKYIEKGDTIYNNEHVVSYYYRTVVNETLILFIDSLCYSYTTIYPSRFFSYEDISTFLDSRYDKRGIYWYGVLDEKVDLCYYNKLNSYILTISHNYILK